MASYWQSAKEAAQKAYNATKNAANKVVMQASKKLTPPPMTAQFEQNGKLSPDEFIAAGDKLTQVCTGWKWKPSSNPNYQSKYLGEKTQYLLLEDVHCYRRIGNIVSGGEEVMKSEEGEDIIVLLPSPEKEEEAKKEDYRSYKMYIIYDEYYHTPRIFFSATDYQGKIVSNQHIRQDIQKQYLDATLTFDPFPFIQNCIMPNVHPCKHADVLKTMSDAMRENGQKVEAHFALLIFLKFITSVIPTVEFDLTGGLNFG